LLLAPQAVSTVVAESLESTDQPPPAIDERASPKTEVPKTAHEPVDPKAIHEMENALFRRCFDDETPEQRMHRLEQFVFGKQVSGDFAPRFANLQKALKPAAPITEVSPPAGLPAATGSDVSKPKSLIEVINEGIDNYNTHRYHNAEDNFEESCAMAPGMSRCFAYLAITKMQLNERQAAIDAFRTSYALDPFGTYGRYAKHCLLVLAGDEAMRKRSPVDSKKILDTALSQIDKQSADGVARHYAEGNAISSARLSRSWGLPFDSRIQSNSARNEGAMRAVHTAESANNLKHLLATKKMPGDANLRAWGTNLTTRYYGNETYLFAPYYIPRERPMELKAIVRALNAAHHPPTAAHHASKSAHHAPTKHKTANRKTQKRS
jgi:hypothetical protein